MVLTPEGLEAYKHAKTVLASTAELQAAITPGKRMAGDFRLGFSTALGDTLLGAPLDALRREFPRLASVAKASTVRNSIASFGQRISIRGCRSGPLTIPTPND